MEAVLDVDKKYIDKPRVKRLEIEYGDMNYIIVNFVEHVIDVDGRLWEYHISDQDNKSLMTLIWTFVDLDECDYWPDKSKDHAPMSTKWRIAFYDEFDVYYHKSGATSVPDNLNKLVKILKELKQV